MSAPAGVDLSSGKAALGVLSFRGADAASFLQGQLSAEIEKLAEGASTLAGFHNPQGRVIALLAVLHAAPGELFAVLPRELVAGVAQRLGKYVLRARVRIADESTSWRVLGAHGVDNSAHSSLPPISWGARRVLLVPAAGVGNDASDGVARAAWERADVAAGLPQVYASTSENFVSQMLNLDLLGAIAFDKGCYTGQEVIARAHYRGRVKRRLQRWHNLSGTLLEPGQAAHTADGRSLIVVRTASDGNIAQELLAVGNFTVAATDVESPESAPAAGPRVSGPLSLPYALPSSVRPDAAASPD
jgi:folate-binding protein YgfZ